MLSHCVPAASVDDGPRQRAWQLLEAFSRSHEVLLACLADGSVSLSQWRALHQRTKQIVIEPVSRLRRLGSRALSTIAPKWSQTMLMRSRLEQPVREWSARGEIESVLCTRLGLMDAALLAGDCHRMVDLHGETCLDDARAAEAGTWIISEVAQAASIAALNKRTILVPASQSRRDLPDIRLADDMDAPIALPTPALHKAA